MFQKKKKGHKSLQQEVNKKKIIIRTIKLSNKTWARLTIYFNLLKHHRASSIDSDTDAGLDDVLNKFELRQ